MDDTKIVELLYKHDEMGLNETKKKYDNYLNNMSYQILYNKDDAEECVNSTYLKVWDTIPPYKPQFLKSFISKIIRQISIDKYRYNHRENRNKNNLVYFEDLDYEISGKTGIDDEVADKLLTGTINHFLEDIDIESRTLFIRKYFFFEDTKSLAKRYNLSESNINVKMLRTRNKLKKYLESEGYEIEKN